MKTNPSILMIFLVLLLHPGWTTAGQKTQVHKVVKKEFRVSPDCNLRISNSFGDVTCVGWDKNQIGIEVTITVGNRSREAAGRILDQIDICITGDASRVEAITKIPRGLKIQGELSIDYLVYMPLSISLDLTNKFGEVYLKELNGRSTICVDYGKAMIGKLNHGNNSLSVKFGALVLESAKGAMVVLEFSKMKLDYAGSLRITSKYSDLNATEVIVLNGTFEGGKIVVEKSSVVTLKSKFSDFSFARVNQELNLDVHFGNIDVENVPASFKVLVIGNKYASVKVKLPSDLSYTLDAETRYGSLKFPRSSATFTVLNVSNQNEIYQGTIGTNPTATVKIRSEFGSIIL